MFEILLRNQLSQCGIAVFPFIVQFGVIRVLYQKQLAFGLLKVARASRLRG